MSAKNSFHTALGEVEWGDILVWHDGPLMFVGKTAGETYMCCLSEREKHFDKWFYIPVTEKRIQEILDNHISMRDMFLKAEKGYVFEVTQSYDESIGDEAHKMLCGDLVKDELPDEGIYLQ